MVQEKQIDYQSILDDFDDANLQVESTSANFVGYKNLDPALFAELDLVSLNETESEDFLTVRYEVNVSAENGNVSLSAILDRGYGEPIIDTIYGLVMENGDDVDVMFIIDGEAIYLSELQAAGLISNVGLFSALKSAAKSVATAVVKAVITVAAPVVTAVIVVLSVSLLGPITDELADYNRGYNLRETVPISTTGTTSGYITEQYLFKSWKYGLTTMDNNGCGAIATYNTLKHKGKISNYSSTYGNTAEMAKIVYDFEAYHGTIALGFGGTNPTHITPYLMTRGLAAMPYCGLTGENDFYKQAQGIGTGQVIIMVYWWQIGSSVGAHYVSIIRDNFGFTCLNGSPVPASIRDYIYSPSVGTYGFIQGWIVG